MKRCKRCGEDRPTSEFYGHKATKDRLGIWCKACLRAYQRERYHADPEAAKAAATKWRKAHPEWERQYVEANRPRLRAAVRRSHAKHREQRREEWKRYYAEHREELLAKRRQQRAADLEGHRARGREYERRRSPRPEKASEYQNRRRARLAGNGYEPVDRWAIYERDGGICHLCGDPVDRDAVGRWKFTLDHLVPIAKGGAHSPMNVATAHHSCNARKGARPVPSLTLR